VSYLLLIIRLLNNENEVITLKFAAVSAIDTSGISLFKELKATLEKKGVEARTLTLTYT